MSDINAFGSAGVEAAGGGGVDEPEFAENDVPAGVAVAEGGAS